MKSIKSIFLFVFLISLIQASTFNGDGTYKMYIGDSATSSNGFDIELKNVTWHYGDDQNVTLDNAVYEVEFDGSVISNPSLSIGESSTASAEGGEKNVTITVGNLSYEPSPPVFTAYVPPKFSATITIESETYIPPPPDVEIEYITISPLKFSAFVEWGTDKSANGTLTIYNKSSSSPFKEYEFSSESESRSVNVTGLKSDTSYDAVVRACTEQSCAESEESFKTLPVTPQISDVSVVGTTNDTAIISWKTDVVSDSRVYYRKLGTSEWNAVPPVLPWAIIQKYFIFNLSDAEEKPETKIASLSGKPGDSIGFAPIEIEESIDISGISLPGEYSIQSEYMSALTEIDAFKAIINQYHSIKLYDLEDDVTYQYKVSSCADRCSNSSIGTFKTELTIHAPYARFVSPPSSVNHGTSAVLLISTYSRNPSGYIRDIKVEWNDGGSKSLIPKLGGDPKSFIHYNQPNFSVISITFQNSGNHQVKLTATDNYDKTTTDTFNIYVNPKTKCTGTTTKYYPSDTTCTNKWPHSGGAGIDYNNGIGACHAFEVCDNNLDYMISDAESCCNGEWSFSPNPTKNRGYGYSKDTACAFALANTRNKGPMESLSAESSMKICKASYLVYGMGSQAIYMKDYYTAEACCKASSFCEGYPKYQSWNPWPQSNIKFNELWCYWNDYWIFGKSPKDGWYGSDTNPESNNNALADLPSHASVNTMNTGTCVDYSFVVTTALRKAGFSKNSIMSMRTPGHLYNVVWLPGDSKYSFIDTVGNNGGDFFTGPGWDWKSGGKLVDHCDYNSDRCSNDGGQKNCPAKSQVYGC